ncbi:retropepsin-like aspartic protease family protein [Undibacterium oligocarboniphilum]|uniref:TIGR02281 family clan AA aspartic protease n=1 Tax=Undibacterium oligocarboniphilum TaxID=666702 RepID=A0A850QKD2_9BURK|nr:TIGR02281 family clan AA aspartic protease [Undibacterium oligocarboniphilum]MBC3869210.1 TIGR02281 family clan AA aspartic protease [Undibacterium oligocarboniphilum]NVO77190.1 TIGR02281 family clan AA aspartic protease [Undibacterium oligocarboniphilum]
MHLLSRLTSCLLLPAFFAGGNAAATDVGVVGLFPGKAILVVDGAPPRAYAVGSMISEDTRLVDADRDGATIITNGKRYVLAMGESARRSAPAGSNNNVVLTAGEGGHFIAPAMINGVSIRMMVDTGASLIALPASDAIRLGLNYKSGRPGRANTAGGIVTTYLIKLDTVKIGEIELHQVDASVIESGLNIPLLGMSFLNRMEMRRSGDQMTLTKRF